MANHHRLCTVLLIVFMTASACPPALAQFHEEPPPIEIGPMIELPQPDSPAVAAILDTKPSTPKDMARAAKILSDLERPDLAREFLKQVIGANLDPKQLAALEEEYGPAMFIEMAAREDLAPEAQLLADAVLTAASKMAVDPKNLAVVIRELNSPSAETRFFALDKLLKAQSAAVWPVVSVLVDPKRKAEHENLQVALGRLGGDAVRPLLAILEAPDPALKTAAILSLGRMDAGEAVEFLLAPLYSKQSSDEVRGVARAALMKLAGRVPTEEEAARLLTGRARNHFDQRVPLRADEEGLASIWSWDPAAGQPAEYVFPSEIAHRMLAARFAWEAFSILPDNEQLRLFHLVTMLEMASYAAGLGSPLEAAPGSPATQAAEHGVEVVEDVLEYAIEHGHSAAATAAARILGNISTSERLLNNGSQPVPLVVATRHEDPRLRMAALEAIMALAPTESFPGSSYVVEALSFFAASSGSPRALVAGPVVAESLRVAGYIGALGYEVDTAITGRDMVRRAIASPDYELAVVSVSIDNPTPEYLLQQLRHDGRTARLPVVLFGQGEQLERARRVVQNDPMAIAYPRPLIAEDVAAMAVETAGLVGIEMVGQPERREQAAKAIAWLAELSASDEKPYDLGRAEDAILLARYNSELGPDAVAVLGRLGTVKSQYALVELASRWTQPLKHRQAAAKALDESIRRYGILLTTEQILQQYDRYNKSADRDADTQQVLASILDSIEAPSRAVKAAAAKPKAPVELTPETSKKSKPPSKNKP